MAKSKDKRKPWERAVAVGSVVPDALPPRQSFLITCEGAETERRYFEELLGTTSVKDFAVRGLGANTLSLVEKALKIRADLEATRDKPYDQAWCVFDRDSFPAQNFNAAIQLALRAGFRIAYSNEAFELWYLLHFDYQNSAMSRALYKDKLTERLGYRYQKNADTTYAALQGATKEKLAMKHADKLLRERLAQEGGLNPASDNPTTTVHCLVRELRNQSPNPPQANDIYQQVHEALMWDAPEGPREVEA